MQRLYAPAIAVCDRSHVPLHAAAARCCCCLQSGRLGGVGLDTHWVEPAPRDDPLYSHPRVLALPHLGSISAEVYDRWAGGRAPLGGSGAGDRGRRAWVLVHRCSLTNVDAAVAHRAVLEAVGAPDTVR